MSYSCLEELQVDLDLHTLDKIDILSKAGCMYNGGWFVITDDGICHFFDKDDKLDNIRKIKQLEEKHIRKDIKKIVIPDSVTSIGACAFEDCQGLTHVIIPNNVMSIGWGAFECCGLTNVIILNGVTSIEGYTFIGCNRLMSMTIPFSVTNIGYDTFYWCDKLTNLTFKGKTLEQVKKMKYYPWGIEDKSIIHVE